MPGGKKTAQRTKGNTRPSSSGRSAQKLLQNSIDHELALAKGSHLGLVGFSCSQGVGDDFESSITLDENCRVILKKMTKKDVTTKLKALQEFKSYCSSCSDECLRSALPFWPRLFNKLCLDNEKRVREAAGMTHAHIVDRAKKHFAPYLKNVIGFWLIAMNDTYAPAASAAQQAFDKAFSATKQTDVMNFCKDDIIELIIEYLFNLTPQILKDNEIFSPEELQDNYERIITCTMQALAKLIQSLPYSEQANLSEKYNLIITNSQFWKYGAHKTLSIKGAWLNVIYNFSRVSMLKGILNPHLNKMLPTVLSSLDENDPIVAVAAWDAVLQIIATFDSCWNLINLNKIVLPKLWKTLKNGCFGNASAIGPCLLPFMCELIRHIDDSSREMFIEDFLRCCCDGLELRALRTSQSEFAAFVTMFLECLQYSVVELVKNKSSQSTKLLVAYLFPVIENALAVSSPFIHNVTIFFSLLSNFVRYIHNQSLSSEDHIKEFQKVEKEFWKKLNDYCLPIVTNYAKPDLVAIENLSCLLRCFGSSKSALEVKSDRRIRFLEEGPDTAEICLAQEHSNDPLVNDLESPLNLLVKQCCVKAFNGYLSNEKSLVHLKLVASILCVFTTKSLIKELIEADGRRTLNEAKLGNTFYVDFIKHFINHEKRKVPASEIFSTLISNIMKISENENDRSSILKDICLSANNIFFIDSLTRQLHGLFASHLFYSKWLRSDEFTELMMNYVRSLYFTDEYLRTERETLWKLLTFFVIYVENDDGIIEPLIIQILDQFLNIALNRDIQPLATDTNRVELDVVFSELELMYNLLSEYIRKQKFGSLLTHRIMVLLFEMLSHCALEELVVDNDLLSQFRELFLTFGTFKSEDDNSTKTENINWLKECTTIVQKLLLHSDKNYSIEQMQSFKRWLESWLLFITNGSTTIGDTSWDILLAILPAEDDWIQLIDHLHHKTALSALFNYKLPYNLKKDFQEYDDALTKTDQSVILVADFTLSMMKLFEPHSFNERYTGTLINLSVITAYCKMCSANNCFKNEFMEDWINNTAVPFWTSVMKINFGKNLILQCMEIVQKLNYLWSEALFFLLSVYTEMHLDVESLICDEILQSSYKLLHTCLPFKPVAAKEVCFVTINHLKQLREDLFDINQMNSAFIKLRICLINLKLQEDGDLKKDVTLQLTEAILLFREELNKVSNEDKCNTEEFFVAVSSFLNLLSEIVTQMAESISPEFWDFILCCLGCWINLCSEMPNGAVSLNMNYLKYNVFSLLDVVASNITKMEESQTDSKFIIEWREFFADKLFHPILNLFLMMSADEHMYNGQINGYVLRSLVKCLENIPLSSLENNNLPPKLVSSWDEGDNIIPVKIKYLLNSFCPLLVSKRREFQVGAYFILKHVTSTLPRYLQLGNLKDSARDDGEESLHCLPGSLINILSHTSEIVSEHFKGIAIGKQVELQPRTDLYKTLHGYLLSACLLFNIIKSGPSEWKTKWANVLRTNGLLHQLTYNLFVIIRENNQDFTNDPTSVTEVFLSSSDLNNLASFVYMEAIRRLPVVVREWWNSLDKKAATYVDKITSRYVTPKLISKDFRAVTVVKKLDNLSLLARPIAREVVATYLVEEFSFELTVQLADNHPLGPVNIQCNRCVGVSKSQWNYWMLQLTTSITQRNGSILDALALWKCHVDRIFEGAEECFVCYTILGANFQVPKLGCSTCKKKFHSSCLFKWFNTSGHSTCPLCRSIF